MEKREAERTVPDVTLDTLGLYCPIPIVLTTKRMRQMKVGQVLEVLSDDEGIKKDMPAWCKTTGNEYLSLIQEDRTYRVFVRKLVG